MLTVAFGVASALGYATTTTCSCRDRARRVGVDGAHVGQCSSVSPCSCRWRSSSTGCRAVTSSGAPPGSLRPAACSEFLGLGCAPQGGWSTGNLSVVTPLGFAGRRVRRGGRAILLGEALPPIALDRAAARGGRRADGVGGAGAARGVLGAPERGERRRHGDGRRRLGAALRGPVRRHLLFFAEATALPAHLPGRDREGGHRRSSSSRWRCSPAGSRCRGSSGAGRPSPAPWTPAPSWRSRRPSASARSPSPRSRSRRPALGGDPRAGRAAREARAGPTARASRSRASRSRCWRRRDSSSGGERPPRAGGSAAASRRYAWASSRSRSLPNGQPCPG